MERITYRKTLDVHKNGIQFMLQGFETADNMSRVVEISLMASGDAIDFPLERVVAMMYVTTPSATEPSINKCTIKDNKVVYDVLPIVEEGITTMQLKIIETGPDGATGVLASPKFAVEVAKSNVDDDGAELKTTFTAIEDFIAKADAAYGSRLEKIELTSDCIFKAYYADGTYYETDVLKKLFLNGNVELSKSYAIGGTGVRAGEDTDNSKYYSSVAKSEALNAKDIMVNSDEILKEVRQHGLYTAFSIDFTTGEVEYVSPSFKFNINRESGEMDAIGQTYTFEGEVGRVVEEWLGLRGILLSELQEISSTHSGEIGVLHGNIADHESRINALNNVRTVDKGGTGLAKVTEGNFLVGNGVSALAERTPADVLDLIGAAKIEKKTYVGKGTYGADNPCVLEFDAVPKLVLVQGATHESFRGRSMLLAINGTTETELFPNFGSSSDSLKGIHLRWSNKVLTWYSTESARDQLNTENKIYNYIVIY